VVGTVAPIFIPCNLHELLKKFLRLKLFSFSSYNGTARFKKNVNICLKTNIYSYLETSGGRRSNLYLNVLHFFNTSVN
jgi:hypothetical protein